MSPQCHTHRKRNIRGIFTTNGEGRSSEGSTEQGKKFMGFDKTIVFVCDRYSQYAPCLLLCKLQRHSFKMQTVSLKKNSLRLFFFCKHVLIILDCIYNQFKHSFPVLFFFLRKNNNSNT